jgi:predicted RNA-binding protein YlxR (DUF448 family)
MTPRTRHVPLRRCVACRASLPKAELIRLVHDGDGWRLDGSQRAGGRGTWVCHACARRDDRSTRRALTRVFRSDTAAITALLGDAVGVTTPSTPASVPRHGGTNG